MLFLMIKFIFFSLQLCLSHRWKLETTSLSPLESGFERLKSSNLFRSPFVIITILFVLFDVELILLIPRILKTGLSNRLFFWGRLLFLLTFTLIVEWLWSGLKWSICFNGVLKTHFFFVEEFEKWNKFFTMQQWNFD